ncbi:MAG: ABC transporter permease [Saccharofermentans sp.]|nr:ABC transporter permease [Saccharofermentans sp.]
MPELLKFEYKRILSSKIIWFMLAYAFLCPVVAVVSLAAVLDIILDVDIKELLDELNASNFKYFTWMIISYFYVRLPLVLGLFSGLFIGRDYSDGFIRNKITAGHSRAQIYFSTLITQLTINVVMAVLYILGGLIALACSPFEVNLNNGEMLLRAFTLMLALAVFTTMFTAIALNIKAKALVVVISALFVMASGPVSGVIGNYAYSSNLIDNYIEACEEKVEEIEAMSFDTEYDYYYYDYDYVVPERKDYINFAWYVMHPLYLVTNAGIEADLIPSTSTVSLITEEGLFEYPAKVSRSSFATSIFAMFSGNNSPLDYSEIEDVKGMQVRISSLIPVYMIKSVIWCAVFTGAGYILFRKKNIN